MSTSKHYPFFGQANIWFSGTSFIVHFTSYRTGTVVWTSNPNIIVVGGTRNDWDESVFVLCTDSDMVNYLEQQLEVVVEDKENKQMYLLSNQESDPNFFKVSYDFYKLKEWVDNQLGTKLVWSKTKDGWISNVSDQQPSSVFIIRSIGTL